METLTTQQHKAKLIKELADLKMTDIGREMTAEEFDYLYDMPIDELVQGIVNLKTLIEFRRFMHNLNNRSAL